MSRPLDITKEMEELSCLLDEMNSGKSPKSEDQETAELLAVAALIKKAGEPVCPPQHILNSIVEQAASAIPSHRKKRIRPWLYSGVLGTVASILLIIGFHMMPFWPEDFSSQLSPNINTQVRETAQNKYSDVQAPAAAPPAALTEKPKLPDPEAKAAPVAVAQPSAAVPVAPPDFSMLPPGGQTKSISASDKSNFVMAEETPVRNEAKSGAYQQRITDIAAESASSAMVPLSLPGKAPDSIFVDRESGTIRQVYDKGTPQEIIITQRIHPLQDSAFQAQSQALIVEKDGETSAAVHTVTIIIADQEVSIEGRLPPQELQQLAETLTLN